MGWSPWHLTKETIQVGNKHMKRYCTTYVIREMQIKMRYQLEWSKSKKTTLPNIGKDMEQWEFSFIAGGNAKWCSHFERNWAIAYKTKHTLSIIFSNHAPWYLPKGFENVYPNKNLHTDVCSIFIHNYQNFELIRWPSRWMDK